MSEQIQELVLRKNHFFRDQYRRTMGALVFMLIVCAGLVSLLLYMDFNRQQPDYYATTITGHVTPMHALSEPVITNRSLLQWASIAARTSYNLDFVHYEKQLKSASIYFSKSGFEQFNNALNQSGLLDTVKNKKLMMSAVVSNTPVILDQEIYHGRFVWRVQMPVLVTFSSASMNQHMHLLITMDIARVPALGAPQGIQIVDYHAVNKDN